MTTPLAPDPNEAVGTVFMVPNESPIKTVADMRGKRAAANFERGFSGVYVPLGEVAAQGYDPDNFFKEIVAAGSPMKKLLLAVQDGRADIALARVCTVELYRCLAVDAAYERRRCLGCGFGFPQG